MIAEVKKGREERRKIRKSTKLIKITNMTILTPDKLEFKPKGITRKKKYLL